MPGCSAKTARGGTHRLSCSFAGSSAGQVALWHRHAPLLLPVGHRLTRWPELQRTEHCDLACDWPGAVTSEDYCSSLGYHPRIDIQETIRIQEIVPYGIQEMIRESQQIPCACLPALTALARVQTAAGCSCTSPRPNCAFLPPRRCQWQEEWRGNRTRPVGT